VRPTAAATETWLQSPGGCSRSAMRHTRRCGTCRHACLLTCLPTHLLTHLLVACLLVCSQLKWPLTRFFCVPQELPPPSPACTDRRLTAARSEPSLLVQRSADRRAETSAETGLQTRPPTLRASSRASLRRAASSGGGTAAAAPLTAMPCPPAERDALRRTLSFEPRRSGVPAFPPPAGYPPVAAARHVRT
jgi:hypothetical protein